MNFCYIEPFNDELMRFDITTNQYVLTEKALSENGINISPETDDTTYAQTVTASVLKRISRKVYNFIHMHNNDNPKQDWLIAHVPGLRKIIYEALAAQALYMYTVGDLALTTDRDLTKRSNISEDCAEVLLTTVPELGICILYTGAL